ncbi:Linamarin synthase 2 [Psilocybe cubensis]|uniref:Linamarin synthase 2 n=1 Tax=Psilocybe cubensis TaxID=181762 RepID=A0ACB8GLK4_PSICU|nr:Linamarin synthase 2 [Psilocybe cubensis]KAH9476096.1 Linamarin synthase 2 [Psilocybe cubensis]
MHHSRSFCNLAARIVKEDEHALVTLLLTPNLIKNAQAEVEAEFRGAVPDSVIRRVRILSSIKHQKLRLVELFRVHAQAYASEYYPALIQGKALTCAVTGTIFDGVTPPNVVVIDYMAYPILQVTRAISGTSVPIIAWITGHVSNVIRSMGPEHFGGIGDLGAKMKTEAARLGVSPLELGDSLLDTSIGTIVKVPGLVEMYDWELFPQILPQPVEVPLSTIVKFGHRSIKEADDVLVTSTHSFEEESMDGLKAWLSEWNKDAYIIGPLLPSGYGILEESDRGSKETRDFLDKVLKEHGENSVIFLSFGTVFWPTSQDYIEEAIEAFIEKNIPFLLCYASHIANLSEEIINKVQGSGIGLVSKWLPQQFILNHPATGWFISHCGHNSVMESLASGIPMLCWPFHADQPYGAAHISENLKVGIELIEVRTGASGLKPLRRNGRQAKGSREAFGIEIRRVIDDLRAERGTEIRKNAANMKPKLANTWAADGGIGRKEFERFLTKYNFL